MTDNAILVDHLAIVGLGLIGGSLARAVRSAGVVGRVSGFDLDPTQCEQALALGVIDTAAKNAADAAQGADVVLLAVPVLETATVVAALQSALADNAILTDVGSTKVSVIMAVEEALGGLPANFVPAHPIAGTEKVGVAASDGTLFRGKHVVITPHAGMNEAAGRKVAALWRAAGATVDSMPPEHHDEIFAATSHLPHVLAYTLVDMLAQMESSSELFNYTAGGFHDFTRIAGSSPKMWHDIVRANRGAVLPLVERYIAALEKLRAAIATDDSTALLDCFTRARDARQRFQADDKPGAAA